MADDGLLLNFELGDSPLTSTVKIKGGRWRDRVRAQKIANKATAARFTPKDASATREQDEDQGSFDGPKTKRQRTDGPRQSAGDGSRPPRFNPSANKGAGPGRHVTSSLFTSNPEAVTKFDEQNTEDAVPVNPSNAPLTSESGFAALGLSDRLVAELHKMDLNKPTAIQKKTIPLMLETTSDAFMQAETGSGKTLAYTLPMVQRVIALSQGQNAKIHRESGIFGIILTPTRELAKQTTAVLSQLLRNTPWLVASATIGGESKKSEKARIRKGVNFLVATPGRLTDHLQNTQVLKLSTVRWLVLDEGDRLMDMGFEEDVKKIITMLKKAEVAPTTYDGVSLAQLPPRRVTVLCSATMKMNVQKLGEMSLEEAVHIAADKEEGKEVMQDTEGADTKSEFTAPSQLKQTYIVTPEKLRLVTLVSFLKFAFARRGSVMKAIVFISCADSVDFHFELLKAPEKKDTGKKDPEKKSSDNRDAEKTEDAEQTGSEVKDTEQEETGKRAWKKDGKKDSKEGAKTRADNEIASRLLVEKTVGKAAYITSAANSTITLHKLHGSLPQATRTATLHEFTVSKDPALLITTDVASRGLDIPSVDLVVELDPAFSMEDHIHRIGRTARAGRPGKAALFLQPGTEEGYVKVMPGADTAVAQLYDTVLQKGLSLPMELPTETHATFTEGQSYSQKAETLQLHFEQRLLSDRAQLELGRKGFRSHIRAYATHVKDERQFFDITHLHLGHVAKSFGLREAPSGIGSGIERKAGKGSKAKARTWTAANQSGADEAADTTEETFKAGRDMVRMKSRMLMKASADEFNIG